MWDIGRINASAMYKAVLVCLAFLFLENSYLCLAQKESEKVLNKEGMI